MSQLTITLDTEDIKVLAEVGNLLDRLAGFTAVPAAPTVDEAATITEPTTRAVSEIEMPVLPPEPQELDPVSTFMPSVATPPELDSAGMPWDERIHASTKTFVQNGTWKMKRGVDATVVASVTAELMGNEPMSQTPSNETIVTPPAAPITDAPVPPPSAPVDPFLSLIADITKAGLAPDYVQQVIRENGAESLPMLKAKYPHLFPLIREKLGLLQ
jgi:hypothetical protein